VETVTFAAVQSLVLAAGGGYLFCASVRAVPGPGGYFDFGWTAAIVVLAVVWLIAFAVLLVLGLAHMRRSARVGPWLLSAWVIVVAGSTAIGWWNIRYFGLWLSAYRNGIPFGLSRPDWHPLISGCCPVGGRCRNGRADSQGVAEHCLRPAAVDLVFVPCDGGR
jgi:hypothetical protein